MAQVQYIRLDTDFFDKPKIKALAFRCGQGAVLCLIRLLCAMGRATDGELSRDAWLAISVESGLTVEDAETLAKYCLKEKIFGGNLAALTNSRVLEDQEALERKREQNRERVSRHRTKQRTGPEATVIPLPPRPSEPIVNPDFVPVPIAPDADAQVQYPDPVEAGDDENLKIALDKLETPGAGKAWERDNRYILAHRRPMKDYPLIWLAPTELADVISKLEASDIPLQLYKELFKNAEAKLRTYVASGKNAQNVSVYNWLTGFLFNELLDTTTKESKLTKTIEWGNRYEQRR